MAEDNLILFKKAEKQPDLFLVMSIDELKEALRVAKELIKDGEKSVELFMCQEYCIDQRSPQQYELKCKGYNVGDFIFTEDTRGSKDNRKFRFMFPDIPFYGLIPINNGEDYIALALSSTLNAEFTSLGQLFGIIESEGFTVEKYYRRNCEADYDEYLQHFANYAQEHPVKSPWTIRDAETLAAALTPDGDTSALPEMDDSLQITLYDNANIEMNIYAAVNMLYGAVWDYRAISNTKFTFPNALIIKSNDGRIPVYIGPDVSKNEIIEIIVKNGLSHIFEEKEFPTDEQEIDDAIPELFLPPRRQVREKEENTTKVSIGGKR